jgi:hypothetical protein
VSLIRGLTLAGASLLVAATFVPINGGGDAGFPTALFDRSVQRELQLFAVEPLAIAVLAALVAFVALRRRPHVSGGMLLAFGSVQHEAQRDRCGAGGQLGEPDMGEADAEQLRQRDEDDVVEQGVGDAGGDKAPDAPSRRCGAAARERRAVGCFIRHRGKCDPGRTWRHQSGLVVSSRAGEARVDGRCTGEPNPGRCPSRITKIHGIGKRGCDAAAGVRFTAQTAGWSRPP